MPYSHSNFSSPIQLAFAVTPNDSPEIFPWNTIDLQPENLMKTEFLWRNESLHLKDFEIEELERQSDLCDAKASFLLANNPILNDEKNPKIETYFKNIKCVVDKTQHPILMHTLAHFYMNGLGTSKDEKLAFDWFSKATELGNFNSMSVLADFYQTGKVVEINTTLAKLFKEASDMSRPEGMTRLSHYYENGIIVKKNTSQALLLLKRAAVLNEAKAMWKLGVFFLNAIGIPKDENEAFSWISQAAERGNLDAMTELVGMYQKGIGVNKDSQMSDYWFQMSNKFSKN